MKEIALYTLDIAQNSITAQARRLDITLTEEGKTITLSIRDDGTGMAPELLARVYKRKEASRVKVPTIVIHGGENEKEYQSAQRVYDTICAEEKLAIWEGSVTHAQYFEDPLVLDKTVRNVFRWFKTH